MALWPHLHQVHLGSGAAAPGKLPGKLLAQHQGLRIITLLNILWKVRRRCWLLPVN